MATVQARRRAPFRRDDGHRSGETELTTPSHNNFSLSTYISNLMKTTVLQSFFKIALLLFGMAIGFGCDDSDDPDTPDKWVPEGMDISCQLVKTVENGAEIEYPMEIAPGLTLKKDLTFEGNAVCNSIEGGYKYNADNGQFKIENLIMTELGCISPYDEAESMYLGYLGKVSSFKLEMATIKLCFGKDSYLEYELKSRHFSTISVSFIFFRHFLSRESNDLSVTFDWFTASSSTKASSNLFKSFTGFFGK